ncbi:transposable element Tcb1 transposase [Trichonephila clavipes]|nr:transposable element Tcb1 transposase [Trichonephila clavipes]
MYKLGGEEENTLKSHNYLGKQGRKRKTQRQEGHNTECRMLIVVFKRCGEDEDLLGGFIKKKVFVSRLPRDLVELRGRIRQEFVAVTRDMLVRVRTEMGYRLDIRHLTKDPDISPPEPTVCCARLWHHLKALFKRKDSGLPRYCGLSFKKIGSRVGRNQTTVMLICDRWMQEGMTDRRGRSHPPQGTTSREDRQIVRMAVTDRSVTSRTVAQYIESVTHHSLSACTIRRRLQ